MVDVSLFTERVFSGGIIAVVMWGFGLFGIYFFTSLYLQNVLGFSPTEAGAAFVPMALLMAVGAVVSERVAARGRAAPGRSALAMLLMAIGIASVSLLGRDASYLALMPSFAVIGIGGGLSVPLTAMVLGAMPVEQAGVASGIFNAAREVAGLLGITVIGAVLTARQSASLRAGHDAGRRVPVRLPQPACSSPRYSSPPAVSPRSSGCVTHRSGTRMPSRSSSSPAELIFLRTVRQDASGAGRSTHSQAEAAVPADCRSSQARTMRAAMPCSASFR